MQNFSSHRLYHRFCSLFLCLLVVAGCSQKSSLKTLQSSDGTTIDYVEVRDEPYHKQQFENASARLYDVRIPPGVSTLYHRHSENTMYLTVAPTKISSQVAGSEKVDELEFQKGGIAFNAQRESPFNHVVINIGETTAHFVGVELYETGRTFSQDPFHSSFYSLEIENPHVRAYRLKLAPGESTGWVRYDNPGFMIVLTPGDLEIRSKGGDHKVQVMAPADWQWHESSYERAMTNTGDSLFEAVVYLLP